MKNAFGEDLRLTALVEALKNAEPGELPETTVNRAEAFYDFLTRTDTDGEQ